MTGNGASHENTPSYTPHPIAAKAFGLDTIDHNSPKSATEALWYSEKRIADLAEYPDALDFVDAHPELLINAQGDIAPHVTAEDLAIDLLSQWNHDRILNIVCPGMRDRVPLDADKSPEDIYRQVCLFYGVSENTMDWESLNEIANQYDDLFGILVDAGYPLPGFPTISITEAFAERAKAQNSFQEWDDRSL